MSDKQRYFNTDQIRLDASGKVLLDDDDLQELERALGDKHHVSGGVDEFCTIPDTECFSSNWWCTNEANCGNLQNTIWCTNLIGCGNGQNNGFNCKNTGNCGTSQNDHCTNSYESGCANSLDGDCQTGGGDG